MRVAVCLHMQTNGLVYLILTRQYTNPTDQPIAHLLIEYLIEGFNCSPQIECFLALGFALLPVSYSLQSRQRPQPNPRTLDEYTPHQYWSANFIYSLQSATTISTLFWWCRLQGWRHLSSSFYVIFLYFRYIPYMDYGAIRERRLVCV